jgi:hypothetical protein
LMTLSDCTHRPINRRSRDKVNHGSEFDSEETSSAELAIVAK